MADSNNMTTRQMSKSNLKPPQTHIGTSSPSPGAKKSGKKGDKDSAKPNASTDNQYVCSVCRNIDSLRSLRLDNEVSDFLAKMSNIKSVTDQLTDTTDTISNIDNHLKHILLNKPSESFENYSNKLQTLDEEVKCFSKTLNDYQNNLNRQTNHNTEVEQNCTNIFNDIQKLFDEFERHPPPPPQTPVPNISDDKIISMCERLLKQQKELEDKISIITSSGNNVNSHNPPQSKLSTQQPSGPSPESVADAIKSIKHVDNYQPTLIETNCSSELIQFLDSIGPKFIDLNGRSVISFGEPYPYVGAPKEKPEAIPSIIQKIISEIEKTYPDSEINSCLINKYNGGSSFLPEHSDNEPIIMPESNIFTVTVGAEYELKFRNRYTHVVETISPANGSLYVMSRQSQNVWSHKIDKMADCTDEVGTRYSITFRSLDKTSKSSTVVLGDSNTKYLKFGDEKGSFGRNMPGRRVETFHTGDIDPTSCLGYQNIIIHVGINDIRDRSPGRKDSDPAPSDIKSHFTRLKEKIELIQLLCPRSSIIVSSILPTKLHTLNYRAKIFNRLLNNYVFNDNPGICIMNHKRFMLNDSLNPEYGCYKNTKDVLHLGMHGIRLLAKTFKDNVLPYRRHIDGRKNSGVTSGGGKNAGAMDGSQPQYE